MTPYDSLSRIRPISVGLLLFSLCCAVGCGGETKRLEPGTCRENVSSDCPPGFKCRGTLCEDIYHPRREIKNY